MMICVNLRERFGSKYRIAFDEAYDARGKRGDNIDPWYMELPCRRGTIYPYGRDVLAVMVDGRPLTAAQLANLSGCRLIQDGDQEKTFLFDVAHFDTVAAIVRPYRKRQVSDAERERLAGLSKVHGFKSHQPVQPRASNSRPEVPA